MAEPLHPGDPRQLGSYYLDGRLGAGGQGVVYEGYGPGGERVAVKALHGVQERDRDRLAKEIEAWRRVAAFCTAKVLHADLGGPVPFVVSEHVAGPDLRRAVGADGPYGPEELRRLAIGVATALVGVHRAKVVHRDLKPENILLGPDGPRVIDFGIARIEEQPTTTGLVKGTLRYMPPERYRGGHGDAKVDVWGWGAVVLFAATGRHAFDGETAPVIAHQVATHEPDVSILEEPLRSLVTAALSKDPAARPGSEDLLLALAGGLDLREAERKAAPEDAPETIAPSRAEVAEAVYAGLDVRAQEAVPQMFLRLVAPGERAEDTLRSARRPEFSDGRIDEPAVERVLHAFTGAGVLVWENGAGTLASAALIRAWPRLREWVDAERGGLDVHQDLAGAARLWDGHGRKDGDLYQGTALARARSWAATGRRHLTLNLVERAFLDAAEAMTRRRGRLRALLSTVLAVLLVIAVGAAAVAVQQRRTVAGQRDRAASAQIAGLAESLRGTQPDLARRLAVAAWSVAGTPEAWSALATVRHQVEDRVARIPDFETSKADLDGKGRLLAAAGGTRVGLWDVDTGRRLGSYTAGGKVDRLKISEDGTTVAVGTADGPATVLDARTMRPRDAFRYRIAGDSGGERFLLSPSGAYLLATGTHGNGRGVTVWDTRTGRATVEREDGLYLRPSFSPPETVLSLTGAGGGLTWVDPRNGEEVKAPDFRLEDRTYPHPVRFSPDGRWAATGTREGARLLSLTSDGHRDVKAEVDHFAAHLHFSHDGKFLASRFTLWGVDDYANDGLLLRHPVSQGECAEDTFRFSADDSELRCVGNDGIFRSIDVARFTDPPVTPGTGESSYEQADASQDGSTMALSAEDGTVEIWSTAPPAKRFEVESRARGFAPGVKLGPDGRRLAVGGSDDDVELWDLDRRRRLGVLPAARTPSKDGARFYARDLAFSPDGKALAHAQREGESHVIRYWNLEPLRMIREIRPESAWAVDFRPDGRAVFAAPNLYAFPSGKVLKKAAAHTRPDRFGADGRTLYEGPASNASSISVYDARTLRRKGDELKTGDLAQVSENVPLAHSPGDSLIATTHMNREIVEVRLWDLDRRGQLGIPLTGHRDRVIAMAFAPDGSSLISLDTGNAFFTHTIAPGRLAAELCAKSGPLTEEQWEARIPDVPFRRTC